MFPERSSKDDERRIAQYYKELRNQGPPFDAATSNPYGPLSAAACAETLVELKFKFKSSPITQIADLYLWPMLWEKYRPGYCPYQEFRAAGRLIECVLKLEDAKALGSKFSCFELVEEAAAAAAGTPATTAPVEAAAVAEAAP